MSDARNILAHDSNILSDLKIVLVSDRRGRVKKRLRGWMGSILKVGLEVSLHRVGLLKIIVMNGMKRIILLIVGMNSR